MWICIVSTSSALVEAMLGGRPSVVTDVGGNAGWIVEPLCGFLAEAPSVRSFGAALERAWAARAAWDSLGRTAHEAALGQAAPRPGRILLELVASDQCVHSLAT